MVGAKQLKTLGLSWFRPGPYVQQGCARGTILLRTGVPVVGRLQVGMAIRVRVSGTRRVPDPTGTGVGTIFHPWVAPIPDPA
jgi:hypothetical protein